MSALDDTLALVQKAERSRFDSALKELENAVRTAAPVKTGETRDKVFTENARTTGSIFTAEVGSKTLQARLTDEGTGLFGPLGQYITPKVARALHWIDDAGKDVFAMRSSGSGKHKGWFSNAVKEWPQVLEASE